MKCNEVGWDQVDLHTCQPHSAVGVASVMWCPCSLRKGHVPSFAEEGNPARQKETRAGGGHVVAGLHYTEDGRVRVLWSVDLFSLLPGLVVCSKRPRVTLNSSHSVAVNLK